MYVMTKIEIPNKGLLDSIMCMQSDIVIMLIRELKNVIYIHYIIVVASLERFNSMYVRIQCAVFTIGFAYILHT